MKKYGVRCTCCVSYPYVYRGTAQYLDCFDVDGRFGTDNLNEAYSFLNWCHEKKITVFEKNNG